MLSADKGREHKKSHAFFYPSLKLTFAATSHLFMLDDFISGFQLDQIVKPDFKLKLILRWIQFDKSDRLAARPALRALLSLLDGMTFIVSMIGWKFPSSSRTTWTMSVVSGEIGCLFGSVSWITTTQPTGMLKDARQASIVCNEYHCGGLNSAK